MRVPPAFWEYQPCRSDCLGTFASLLIGRNSPQLDDLNPEVTLQVVYHYIHGAAAHPRWWCVLYSRTIAGAPHSTASAPQSITLRVALSRNSRRAVVNGASIAVHKRALMGPT